VTQNGKLSFTTVKNTQSEILNWFAEGLSTTFQQNGHAFSNNGHTKISHHTSDAGSSRDLIRMEAPLGFVLNVVDAKHPQRIHRKGQGTFVVSIIQDDSNEDCVLKRAYPYLLWTLSNMVIFLRCERAWVHAHFITPEGGHYQVIHRGNERKFFGQVYQRLAPLVSSHLFIKNVFETDLPKSLWHGDAATEELMQLGRRLDAAGLLPSAFPIEEYLAPDDLRHLKRLFGVGGLSYGNMSTRAVHDPSQFWISASGVNKGNLQIIGRDILLVKGLDPEQQAIRLSVPPNVHPRHASVDTIEHIMIYREHPSVGAILHVHSWWSDPIPITQTNYPCGTIELATEVSDLVRQADDPSQAIIGLKNHGLTITGTSISDILQRTLPNIVPQVPMS
jgi:ribulose-5-phosphate 4-epimerase/fuculose-1-phosphate aldolase